MFRGLKFEPDAVIEQKGAFCKGLNLRGLIYGSLYCFTRKINGNR
jgi:hypothetical protein